MADRQRVELTGVPETMLWTLNNRAAVARRPGSFFQDPDAVAIADAIDYPFEQNFGKPDSSHAYRAFVFDEQVRRYLADHPGCTVVELAAGLETQFRRVDDGRVRWLAVDLPEAIDVRERFLPSEGRHQNLAADALDPTWLDQVDAGAGVYITAGGLLMYFEEADVRRLVTACAERFPGGGMVFDAIPRWFSRKTLRGYAKTPAYTAPRMPSGLNVDEQSSLRVEPGDRRRARHRRPSATAKAAVPADQARHPDPRPRHEAAQRHRTGVPLTDVGPPAARWAGPRLALR